jgi:hypothetical protein
VRERPTVTPVPDGVPTRLVRYATADWVDPWERPDEDWWLGGSWSSVGVDGVRKRDRMDERGWIGQWQALVGWDRFVRARDAWEAEHEVALPPTEVC